MALLALIHLQLRMEDARRLYSLWVIDPFAKLASLEFYRGSDVGLVRCIRQVVIICVAPVRLVANQVQDASDARPGGRRPHVEDIGQLRRRVTLTLLRQYA